MTNRRDDAPPLTDREIEALLRLVDLTRDEEIDCDECLSLVARFAERELAGKSVPESLEAVRHHLAVCAECDEEYRALQRAIAGLEE